MGLARQLAERVAALRYEDLPPEAVYWGKVALADTVGVALAGAHEDAPRILEEVMGLSPAAGPCLILGSNRRAGCLDAALINGTAAHVLDFDNTAFHMGGHVSAVMVPALIAASEAFGASGRDFLLAHAAGFEMGARIGNAVNFHHSEKGWHPTATLGVFAVAAACARLLNLTAAQTETALAISTSLAAGVKANFGTMTKSLHVGQCARSGLMAVLLSRKGFTANADAFEHRQGFFNLFNGSGNFDATGIVENWGRPFEIVEPGAGYKRYPCCYSTHSAVEATLNLVREHGRFDAAAVSRIDSWTAARGLAHTDRPQPDSALNAKFSVQYCVARAALNGEVRLDHFEGDAWRDTAVQSLLPRVHAAPYGPAQFSVAEFPFGAEVKITLTNGNSVSAKVERPLGRTSGNPIASAQMQEKFEDCARRVLTAEAAAAAYRMMAVFETVPSVKNLTALLEAAPDGVSD